MRCGPSYDPGGKPGVERIDPAVLKSLEGRVEDAIQRLVDHGAARLSEPPRAKDPAREAQAALNTATAEMGKSHKQLNHQGTLLHQARERVSNLESKVAECEADAHAKMAAHATAKTAFEKLVAAHPGSGAGRHQRRPLLTMPPRCTSPPSKRRCPASRCS